MGKMRILIMNTFDMQGGAAKAAYRLHIALQKIGIDSSMLVQNKTSNNYDIYSGENKIQNFFSKIRFHLDKIPLYFYKNRKQVPFSINWIPTSRWILKKIREINPDIIHLHWINGGMIKIEDLLKIKKPIVWTMHDMWVFTGGCHYNEGCSNYRNSCGKCKMLNSKKKNDISKKIFKRKLKTFTKINNNITFIALSSWLNDIAKKSTLLKNKRIINLPNPIDTNFYKPVDKKIARQILNLPLNKKLILFGAIKALDDPRKGFKQLRSALKKLKYNNIEFIVFGSSRPENKSDFKYFTHYLGYINDDISLKILYNAADVMVVPSLQENLSNTIMESLSCGTPVVAFDVGGNKDMITHKFNGYLAKPFNTTDLAEGIEWIINNNNYYKLCKIARKKVVEEFDSILVAEKYKNLYEEILK